MKSQSEPEPQSPPQKTTCSRIQILKTSTHKHLTTLLQTIQHVQQRLPLKSRINYRPETMGDDSIPISNPTSPIPPPVDPVPPPPPPTAAGISPIPRRPALRVTSEFDSDSLLFFHKVSCKLFDDLAKLKLSFQNSHKREISQPQLALTSKHLSIQYDIGEQNVLVKTSFDVGPRLLFKTAHDVKVRAFLLHSLKFGNFLVRLYVKKQIRTRTGIAWIDFSPKRLTRCR